MSEPAHILRWNVFESSMKDWVEELRPKPIRKYWDKEINHFVTVYEPKNASGDIQ